MKSNSPTPKKTLPPHLNERNCLPVSHPEFLYPTSRNIYSKKLESFQNLGFADQNTEIHQGHWREQFLSPILETPLHVEIGCNGGHVLLEWAKQNPKQRYIGLDWKYKQIYRACEKADKYSLKNTLFLRSHADRIRYVFGESEIDYLYLFFPDPWQKKSQQKNRTLQAHWLSEVAQLMKKGGVFHIKTDHHAYFEFMLEEISNCEKKSGPLWTSTELTWDLHKDHPNPLKLNFPEVTLFEKLFIKDKVPIKSIKLIRN
ncbi:MAG: tRNA (guanosine(46)-N7)-methyltransferase TrmB [Bdellovibrionaceae bacterium]|nr:tRNA (guanosine(46)-N7)-methyltransferase TrmB [Pseudobdellovibrionaceae bacterium]|tara:strand:- start:1769 stop:2542 length:774 start_codon:yes stop_codon:yes gene_type:complete